MSARASRAWILLAASLLLALAAAGCGGGKKAKQLSVGEIVAQTAKKTAALKSFHFVFKVENAPSGRPGLNLTFADGDLIVPDKLRASVAGTLSGISLKSEIVFVGPKQFLKDPLTQTWRTLETKTSPVAFFDPAKGVLAVIKGASKLELAGSESVGGADSYRLKGVVRARDVTAILGNPPSDKLVNVELWVGKSDLVLRRIRLEGPVSAGEAANIARTVEISSFDKSVKIEPPQAAG